MKLLFNITFHWQLDQLKFHLDHLFTWGVSNTSTYVITSAHESNLTEINLYCMEKYPEKDVQYLFISEDKGYHVGTIVNVVESLKFANENVDFDYLVNIEADNMFYDERKLLNIIDRMQKNDKHLLLIEEGYGKTPQNRNYSAHINYNHLHITTINVFSKSFVAQQFPLEYYQEIMNWGWSSNPGTPYESYISYAFSIKHDLKIDEDIMNYWNKFGMRLEYDRDKSYIPGWYYPDCFTPDKFLRWGIVNFPATAGIPGYRDWHISKQFIELHKPLMYDAE